MTQKKEAWVNFRHDPENSFHNLVAMVSEEVTQEDLEHFLFHQLRTELSETMISETRDPAGSLRVMNIDAAKIVKGRKKGVLSGILYLAAGDSAGVEVCPHRTGKFPTWRHPDHPGSNIMYGAKNKSGQCVSIKDAMFHLSDPERASEFVKNALEKANSMESPLDAFSYLGKEGFKKDAGCSGLCLGHTAGHARVAQSKKDDMESNPVQRVRIERTKRLLAKGEEANTKFLADIEHDIRSIKRKAEREGLVPAVRLNGTSDLYWHRMGKLKKDGQSFFERFPEIQFYDYTKNLDVVLDFLDGKLPDNYHVTFSFGGSNWPQAKKVLDNGGNVAVGFRLRKKDDFPLAWRGYEVIDGDETDLRFADPTSKPGKIVGLRTKGSSFSMDSNFIVEPDDPEIVWPEESPFHEKQGRKGVEEIRKTRADREKTAAKYVIADKIEDDIYEAFEMIYDNQDLTLQEVQKRTKIPMKDLKQAYDDWSGRFRLTNRGTKVLPKEADRRLTSKSIRNSFQMLSRRAMKVGAYQPSNGMKGSDLRAYIKGKVQEETTFEDFMDFEGTMFIEAEKPLNTNQERALKILKNSYEHARKPNVDLSMQWVAPSSYNMKAASFDHLCRKGLAERKMNPGKGSNRWYYRWIKPLNEGHNSLVEAKGKSGPVEITISADSNEREILKKMTGAIESAMSVHSDRQDFSKNFVPYGDTRVPEGSSGKMLYTTISQDRPIKVTVKNLKKSQEPDEVLPSKVKVEVDTDAGLENIIIALSFDDVEDDVVTVSFDDQELEQVIED